jgi:hypothetical protein
MKLLLLAGILSLSIVGAGVARADDCAGKLTTEQSQTYASLTPANQQQMARMKNKDGSPVTCEFRAGLLDMLGHYPPNARDAGFQQMLDKTFVKQN